MASRCGPTRMDSSSSPSAWSVISAAIRRQAISSSSLTTRSCSTAPPRSARRSRGRDRAHGAVPGHGQVVLLDGEGVGALAGGEVRPPRRPGRRRASGSTVHPQGLVGGCPSGGRSSVGPPGAEQDVLALARAAARRRAGPRPRDSGRWRGGRPARPRCRRRRTGHAAALARTAYTSDMFPSVRARRGAGPVSASDRGGPVARRRRAPPGQRTRPGKGRWTTAATRRRAGDGAGEDVVQDPGRRRDVELGVVDDRQPGAVPAGHPAVDAGDLLVRRAAVAGALGVALQDDLQAGQQHDRQQAGPHVPLPAAEADDRAVGEDRVVEDAGDAVGQEVAGGEAAGAAGETVLRLGVVVPARLRVGEARADPFAYVVEADVRGGHPAVVRPVLGDARLARRRRGRSAARRGARRPDRRRPWRAAGSAAGRGRPAAAAYGRWCPAWAAPGRAAGRERAGGRADAGLPGRVPRVTPPV